MNFAADGIHPSQSGQTSSAAKQSATRVARIEKAMPAIFEGRGFLERR